MKITAITWGTNRRNLNGCFGSYIIESVENLTLGEQGGTTVKSVILGNGHRIELTPIEKPTKSLQKKMAKLGWIRKNAKKK